MSHTVTYLLCVIFGDSVMLLGWFICFCSRFHSLSKNGIHLSNEQRTNEEKIKKFDLGSFQFKEFIENIIDNGIIVMVFWRHITTDCFVDMFIFFFLDLIRAKIE